MLLDLHDQVFPVERDRDRDREKERGQCGSEREREVDRERELLCFPGFMTRSFFKKNNQ